jgi:hypothetical protein
MLVFLFDITLFESLHLLLTIFSSNMFRNITYIAIVNFICCDWYVIKVVSIIDPCESDVSPITICQLNNM